MKRASGVLALLIGAPVLAIAALMIGVGVLGIILEHGDGEAVLSCYCGIMAGAIPALVGGVLCLASRVLIRDSRTSSPK